MASRKNKDPVRIHIAEDPKGRPMQTSVSISGERPTAEIPVTRLVPGMSAVCDPEIAEILIKRGDAVEGYHPSETGQDIIDPNFAEEGGE